MGNCWTDKIVIVTGGGGGMGQAAAKRFADAGATIFAGVPYTASKWAVHGLLSTVRMQMDAHGIVVSEYAPGEANTPIIDQRPAQPKAEHHCWTKTGPLLSPS